MNNRTQQRFDRSIREAMRVTREAASRRPARAVPVDREQFAEPRRVTGRMQLMRDRETGGTVLVPWDHPDAVAWRTR